MNTLELPESKLTKQQYKSFGPRPIKGYAPGAAIWAHVRFDDECGNGHNSFAITGSVREPRQKDIAAGGCLHDDIAEAFPELAQYIKWHLCSTDGPMHYLANTIYWAEGGNLDNARNSAIWPEATLEQLSNKEALMARLPKLMEDFKAAMLALGFEY